MQSVEELIERVRKNEEIARKLFDIEVQILNITRFGDYFEKLLQLVQEKFQIEHVWITLTDALANQRIIEVLGGGSNAPVKMSALDFHTVTQSRREPLLENQRLSRYWPLMPSDIRRELGSLAVLPLVVEGRLLGSLNLGSPSSERYRPDKDSFFLHQLAVKASMCLASVAAHEQVRFLATRDSLTLLRNRRELEETLEQELSRAKRHKTPLALVFIDCDDFKLVNDSFGHDCGDVYLRQVAESLNHMIRRSDSAFRFAGDEFVLLLPNQSREGAETIAARIREELLQNPFEYGGQPVQMQISYGVADVHDLGEWSVRHLLKIADQRLYAMKALKSRSCFKPPSAAAE